MKNKMKQINIVDSTGKKNGSKSFTVAEEIKRLWYIYTEKIAKRSRNHGGCSLHVYWLGACSMEALAGDSGAWDLSVVIVGPSGARPR